MSPTELHPGTTAIDRLRLRVPPGTEWAARRAVEETPWPRVQDGAWVILRELRVRDTPERIGPRAVQAARSLIQTSVGPGTPGAEQGGAVRFTDLAELLGWLCADLAAGRAAGRWYWRRWRGLLDLGAVPAAVQVLGDHAALLPGITAALERIGALGPVWSALSPHQADALQVRLAQATGLILPRPSMAQGSLGLGPGRLAWLAALPPGLRRRWGPVLGRLGREDPRAWLAACVVALEWRPLWTGSAGLLAALAGRLAEPVAPGPPERVPGDLRDEGGRPSPRGASREDPGWAAADSGPSGTPGPDLGSRPGLAGAGPSAGPEVSPAAPQAGSEDPAPVAGTGAGEGSRPPRPAPGPVADLTGAGSPATPGQGPPALGAAPWGGARGGGAVADQGSAVDTSSPGFEARTRGQTRPGPGAAFTRTFTPTFTLETEEGGLFYLINFLDRPEAQALLAHADRSGPWPEGWVWLWGLGRRLGLRPQGALARFLGGRLGLPDPAAIADLPPLPEGPALMDLGARLYDAEVWGPGLLVVPARVRHTSTHLDCHLPLGAVRLEVRLAGLDLNPGWVPWLGRVVTLHYEGPGGWR